MAHVTEEWRARVRRGRSLQARARYARSSQGEQRDSCRGGVWLRAAACRA